MLGNARLWSLLFLLFPLVAYAQLSFSPRSIPGVATSDCVITADFNGDTNPDVAVNDKAGKAIAVFLGDGAGNLSSPTKYPLSSHFVSGPDCPALGDLNSDGKPDLVAYSQTSDVIAILLNSGSGFAPERDISASSISSVVVDDFNGDGKKNDLAAMDRNTARVLVYRNDGALNFTPYIIGLDRRGYLLASGDFDGDGNSDLAVAADQTAEISALLTFRSTPNKTRTPYEVSFDPWFRSDGLAHILYMQGAEFRANDRSELLLSTTGKSAFDRNIKVYAFKSPTSYEFSPGYISYEPFLQVRSFAVGNFNPDGYPDLVAAAAQDPDVTKPQGAAVSWIGIRDEGFSVRPGYGFGVVAANRKVNAASSNGMLSIAAADFNRDGKLDALALDSAGNFTLLRNTTLPFSCSPETAPEIHLCMPHDSEQVSTPTRVQAMGTLETSISRFELWSLNTKRATVRDSGEMDVQVNLPPGEQLLEFVARSASGDERKTENINITVNSSSCPPPAATGVNVCSPGNNSVVSSPLYAHATAKMPANIYRFELWIDSVKIVSNRYKDSINQSLNVTAGKHKLEFVVRDTAGNRSVKTVFVTVR